jgi:hypothetical protein
MIAILFVAFATIIYLIFLQPKPIAALSYNGEILKLISGRESWYINGTYYAYQGNGMWQYHNGTSWVLVSIDDLPVPYILSLDFHSGVTLYNCEVKITYQTMNGTWLIINENIGIVDLSKNVQFELGDYQIESTAIRTADKTVQFSNLNPLATIKIEAYGNSKP